MATVEKRHIRIEDWNGNRYYTESNFNDTIAGTITYTNNLATSSESGAINYTDGEIVELSDANNGYAVLASPAEKDIVMFSGMFGDIPFGECSFDIRLKSLSIPQKEHEGITVKVYAADTMGGALFESIIEEFYIGKEAITKADNWMNISGKFNYTGTYTGSNGVLIRVIANAATGLTMYLDSVAVAKSMPSSNCVN